ncbi:protein jag [Sedimentibacter sp. zth1]|uniref:RNA-binding cell elongation regulator Jag/EloR n=1 Tax=Sedimentibacter sp. zth1 TaxID=2816908 RepID=UPI001A931249|nr:RNA-binding cell elongation regulator Jag/EloR [Sedimentibacter sp. zth1]QSX05185.1 protein jag [Sedimentibacter sp. zth1]
MSSIIIEKPTVDEAVKVALEELKAEINEVDIDILKEPSKGILSFLGSKVAKVKVTVINGPEEKAKNYIETVCKYMNIQIEYEIKLVVNVLKVDITKVDEKDKGILIGKRGNTLDEIQFLLSLVVNKNRESYIRTLVNVEDYREKREETLKKLARKTADKCRYYNKKIRLEPMNPYERRIIHSTLQEEKDIMTYSEGDEPYRKVVIDKR